MTEANNLPDTLYEETKDSAGWVQKETDKVITAIDDAPQKASNYIVNKILGWFRL